MSQVVKRKRGTGGKGQPRQEPPVKSAVPARPSTKRSKGQQDSDGIQQSPSEQPVLPLSDTQLESVAELVAAKLIPVLTPQPISGNVSGSSHANTEIMNVNSAMDGPIQVESIYNELGSNIPGNLREKICNGEYVDLALLLSKPGFNETAPSIGFSDGSLVLRPKKACVKTTNISQWTDAFLIYASVYASVHPISYQGLLKYLHTIRLGAQRYGGFGWKEYDEQFRLKRAKQASSPWCQVRPGTLAIIYAPPKCWIFSEYNTGQ